MGDSDILVALSGIYLTEDFRRKQTSDITTQSGRAERAAHFAAYLSRDTDIYPYLFHQNAFGIFIAAETEKVFNRSVLCGYLLALDSALLSGNSSFSFSRRDSGRLVIVIESAFLMDPRIDLLACMTEVPSRSLQKAR